MQIKCTTRNQYASYKSNLHVKVNNKIKSLNMSHQRFSQKSFFFHFDLLDSARYKALPKLFSGSSIQDISRSWDTFIFPHFWIAIIFVLIKAFGFVMFLVFLELSLSIWTFVLLSYSCILSISLFFIFLMSLYLLKKMVLCRESFFCLYPRVSEPA